MIEKDLFSRLLLSFSARFLVFEGLNYVVAHYLDAFCRSEELGYSRYLELIIWSKVVFFSTKLGSFGSKTG